MSESWIHRFSLSPEEAYNVASHAMVLPDSLKAPFLYLLGLFSLLLLLLFLCSLSSAARSRSSVL